MQLEKEIFQKKFKNEYHKALVNMIYSYNWLISSHIDFLKPFDITVQQYNVLRILRGQHPNMTNIKLIRERMLDKMSDASRIVEKLRQKGLLKRETCPLDRRNVDIIITEKGLNLLSQIDSQDNLIESLLHNLNEKEIAQLNKLLDKMRR